MKQILRKILRKIAFMLPQSIVSKLPLIIKLKLGLSLNRWEHEVSFWQNWFEECGGKYHEDYMIRTTKERRKEVFPEFLEPFLADLESKTKGQLKVLDVGSGPISVLAWGHEIGLFSLMCLDALGSEYDKLFKKHRISPPTPISNGYGEQINFEGEFDIVFTRNALDHCVSPKKVFRNMVRAVREGGYVIIGTAIDEGAAQNWSGGHQHSLNMEGFDLILSDRDRNQKNLTCDLPLKHIWSQRSETPPPHRGWIDVIYQKYKT
jgi:SAM-dependent methyltransferase